MKPPLNVIETGTAGRLATMGHPRGSWLADDMAALAGAGVAVLVSTLTDDERERLGLTRMGEAALAAGMAYVQFSIADRGVPDPGSDVRRLADRLACDLRAGRSVVIQCWAAIGRSSLLAAATLVRLGVSPTQAWQRISIARGMVVPGTERQRAWLNEFAAEFAYPPA